MEKAKSSSSLLREKQTTSSAHVRILPPPNFSISDSICKILSPIDSTARSKRRFLRAGRGEKINFGHETLAGARILEPLPVHGGSLRSRPSPLQIQKKLECRPNGLARWLPQEPPLSPPNSKKNSNAGQTGWHDGSLRSRPSPLKIQKKLECRRCTKSCGPSRTPPSAASACSPRPPRTRSSGARTARRSSCTPRATRRGPFRGATGSATSVCMRGRRRSSGGTRTVWSAASASARDLAWRACGGARATDGFMVFAHQCFLVMPPSIRPLAGMC